MIVSMIMSKPIIGKNSWIATTHGPSGIRRLGEAKTKGNRYRRTWSGAREEKGGDSVLLRQGCRHGERSEVGRYTAHQYTYRPRFGAERSARQSRAYFLAPPAW